jgi:regulation of enolase protein 1 (concanavalin A-like superfamily)
VYVSAVVDEVALTVKLDPSEPIEAVGTVSVGFFPTTLTVNVGVELCWPNSASISALLPEMLADALPVALSPLNIVVGLRLPATVTV